MRLGTSSASCGDDLVGAVQGCLKPITVKIPAGSLLSPCAEAAVVGGNVLTSQRVTDVVLKAFNAAAASQVRPAPLQCTCPMLSHGSACPCDLSDLLKGWTQHVSASDGNTQGFMMHDVMAACTGCMGARHLPQLQVSYEDRQA